MTTFAAPLLGITVLGADCIQGSKPVLNEKVRTASVIGHELKNEIYIIFKTIRVSRCCSL